MRMVLMNVPERLFQVILSGAHMAHVRSVLRLLKKKNADDIFLFAGGIIPERDVAKLKKMGVLEIFTPGAETSGIIKFVRKAIGKEIE